MFGCAGRIPRSLSKEVDSQEAQLVLLSQSVLVSTGEHQDPLWDLMAAFPEKLWRAGTIILTFKAFFPPPAFFALFPTSRF